MARWLDVMLAMSLLLGAASQSHAQESSARSPSAPVDGRTLFVTHCASCHGTSARGDGPAADSLRNRPSDLTQLAKQNGGMFPSAKTSRIIDGREVGAHGSVEMPVWGNTFKRTANGDEASVEARIDALVRYLEAVQERAGQ